MSKHDEGSKRQGRAGPQPISASPAMRSLQAQVEARRPPVSAAVRPLLAKDQLTPSGVVVSSTRSQQGLIDAATLIAMDKATDRDLTFLGRQLVQATLPHRDPGKVPVWSRQNGSVSLTIQQGYLADGTPLGHPFGTIPRLLMYWMTTEAVRRKEPKLVLGATLAAFMEELGLDHSRGGVRSDRRRLEEQMRRLFGARISFEGLIEADGMQGKITQYLPVARRTVYWWNRKDPGQSTLWESYVELDQDFYKAITSNPVPVDLRALRAIKHSPLALDLYSLLTYEAFRARKTDKARFLSWQQLQAALGTNYADLGDLRGGAKDALRKITAVYSGLCIGKRQGGIEVLPESTPSIQER